MTSETTVPRVDAVAKITGRARYTDDFTMPGMLTAHYLRSRIAHGRIVEIDTERAKALEGVEAVLTFKDVPDIPFATAGHPYALDPAHGDVADKRLLTETVRYIGDEIAVVAATNEAVAREALRLIEVRYEPWKPLVEPADILATDAREIHPGSKNLAGAHRFECGGDLLQARAEAEIVFEGEYRTRMLQHVHLENHTAFAYMDDLKRIVIVSSTQIPHIVRRIVGQALDIPWSQVRVIKPYIGGGFGAKQDVILEPMVAFLTLRLDGRPVRLTLSREECMLCTRNRHPMSARVRIGVRSDGTMRFREMKAEFITGAYASHGHSIAAAAGSKSCLLYPRQTIGYQAQTLYANIPIAGAMRAYGSPQVIFALECAVEDTARKLGIDPLTFRLQNLARAGDTNPFNGRPISSCGVIECVQKGRQIIEWDRKRAELPGQQSGPQRRGLGLACFSYGTGTYPVGVEIAGCRLILNQDGTFHLQTGATEIGQGSDTVLAQMAARTIGVPVTHIQVVSTQDTDVSPFDTGAYASRQAYVSGNAVHQAAVEMRRKILAQAAVLHRRAAAELDICVDRVVVATDPRTTVVSLRDLALNAYYDKDQGGQLTADVSLKTTANPPSFGCTFVDLTVDIPLCRIRIHQIVNVHDSGRIINHSTAHGQVEGGMGMGIGAALTEQVLIDPESGRVYNHNLLDYKVPTCIDTPDLDSAFVETEEPTARYGNKSLGEPPIISPPPAIRNAVLDATGVAVNELPLSPQALFTHFRNAGLI
jgi:xanthine dehydrogenase molybdenum-binding subunit